MIVAEKNNQKKLNDKIDLSRLNCNRLSSNESFFKENLINQKYNKHEFVIKRFLNEFQF